MTQHYETCFLSDRPFPFSQGKYYGRWIPAYRLSVCASCLKGNWDGLNRRYESKFEKHLYKNSIFLAHRNNKGLYPIDIR
jgi:hypothetical protein